ncbi:MAG: pentapeptide repeat-containing protein, partial [Selenomonadaceae bacterium]|nr:pentapeptide repeat-containing protein [Selenomonadaceae bacterium]
MIDTFSDYTRERYEPLELEFITATKKSLSDDLPTIKSRTLTAWRQALSEACEVQRDKKISCAYMSVSFLNTSVAQPILQIDFYDRQWVFGEPFARSRMNAEFLLTHWKKFTTDALDDKFFVRNKITQVEIKSLFWMTLDKLAFLFTCCAKYFATELKTSPEFAALAKAGNFYVTCGTYLDWQNRLCAVLPEVDLLNPDANEDMTFRDFRGKIFRQQNIADLNLRGCNFDDCLFRDCTFTNLNFADAGFSHCRFYSSRFDGVKFAGAKFVECKFKDCAFKNSSTAPKDVDADEYFAPLR